MTKKHVPKKRSLLGVLKRLIVAGIALLSVLIALGLWNHRRGPVIDTNAAFLERVDATLANSHQWMRDHRELMKVQDNPALTHMVHAMNKLAPDPLLQALEDDYHRSRPTFFWRRMVLPHVDTERFTLQRVAGMAEYQRWFAYGVDPEGTPITDQDRASLWDAEQHQGVDLTHQLFAHYFYLLAPHAVAKPLHPDSERKKFMAQLALRIHQEATLDFRVSDLFLQRIATLLMIGRADLVEPRWVERVMTNQLADGGWRWSWKGWGPGRWSIGSPNSPSHQHPTMQAAWLLTQIRHRYPQWVDQHYPSDG